MCSLVVAVAGCAELVPFPAGVCGNGLLEAGEECDPGVFGRADCGSPSDALRACRPVCVEATRTTPEVACGVGYVCGGDRICRAFGGQLAPGSPVVLGREPTDMVVGDFDGDGVPDAMLATERDLFFAYGDGAGGFGQAERQPVGTLLGTPQALALNPAQDRATDVVVALKTGALVLAGDSSRAPLSLAFDRPISGAESVYFVELPTPRLPLDPLVLVGRSPSGEICFISASAPDRGSCVGGSTVDGGAPIEPFPVGDVDGDGVPEVVIAQHGGGVDRILVATVRYESGGALAASVQRIAVPGTLRGGVLLGDVDGDGLPDLIVDVDAEVPGPRGGTEAVVMVAHGQRAALPLGMLSRSAELTRLYRTPNKGTGVAPVRVLGATGDFNRDGVADLITLAGEGETALLLSARGNGGVVHVNATEALLGPLSWSSAAVGDINRDELPDVVGLNATDGSVEVLIGNGRGAFNPQRYPVGAATSALLRLADIDGDLVTDIVFTEPLRAGSSDLTILDAMFGQRDGFPTQPLALGVVDGYAVGLDVGQLGGSELTLDAIKDVIVRTPAGGRAEASPAEFTQTARLFVFFGAADRSLRAPKALVGEPIRVFAGDYLPEREGTELFALVKGPVRGQTRLTVVESQPTPGASTSTEATIFDLGLGRGASRELGVDRAGCQTLSWEAISCAEAWSSPSDGGESLWLFRSSRCEAYGGPILSAPIGDVAYAGVRLALASPEQATCQLVPRFGEQSAVQRVLAAPLVGAASPDLVVATLTALWIVVDPPDAARAAALDGARQLPAPEKVTIYDAVAADLDVDGKQDVVVFGDRLEINGDELAIITELWWLRGADGLQKPTRLLELSRFQAGAVGLPNGGMPLFGGGGGVASRLGAADLDGDGLVDLVLESGGVLRPLLAVSKSPRDATRSGSGLSGEAP